MINIRPVSDLRNKFPMSVIPLSGYLEEYRVGAMSVKRFKLT